MNDPVRKDVLRLLEQLSETCPEYRFGQMIANLTMLARGHRGRTLGYRGRRVARRGTKHLSDWNQRHASVA